MDPWRRAEGSLDPLWWRGACRSDANEASDHALYCTDDGWFAEENDVKNCPCEETHGCTHIGVDDGDGGIHIGGIRVSSVESCPPQPQQSCSCQHEQHVVGWEPLSISRQPWSNLYIPQYLLFTIPKPHRPPQPKCQSSLHTSLLEFSAANYFHRFGAWLTSPHPTRIVVAHAHHSTSNKNNSDSCSPLHIQQE